MNIDIPLKIVEMHTHTCSPVITNDEKDKKI